MVWREELSRDNARAYIHGFRFGWETRTDGDSMIPPIFLFFCAVSKLVSAPTLLDSASSSGYVWDGECLEAGFLIGLGSGVSWAFRKGFSHLSLF